MSETAHIPGTHPETGLYDVNHMPMGIDPIRLEVRQKQLLGEPLTVSEGMLAGRDSVVTELGTYQTKPDHVYRSVGHDALSTYQEAGAVVGFGEEDEYQEGNNAGVDWYLGGVALRYGAVILEAPALPDYFQPAANWGHNLAKDPMIRHMKSSGHANPIPMEHVAVIRPTVKDA